MCTLTVSSTAEQRPCGSFLGLSSDSILESHFQSQKDCYEKEIEALNFKVVHLSQEINHLQKLFREETDINESIRHEVTRLTSENMV